MDLVSQKTEFLGRRSSFAHPNDANPMMTSLWTPSKLLSYSVADLTLDESLAPDMTFDVGDGVDDGVHAPPVSSFTSLNLTVKAVLQTPVIVLPRTPTSAEVLMAHLGKIVIENSSEAKKSENVLSTVEEDDEDLSNGKLEIFGMGVCDGRM